MEHLGIALVIGGPLILAWSFTYFLACRQKHRLWPHLVLPFSGCMAFILAMVIATNSNGGYSEGFDDSYVPVIYFIFSIPLAVILALTVPWILKVRYRWLYSAYLALFYIVAMIVVGHIC